MRFILICSLILGAFSCTQNTSKIIIENSDIAIGQSIKSRLDKQGEDTFRLNLMENSFITGFANQLTIDVEIHILNADRKEISFHDDQARGRDYFYFVAKNSGIYYIVIKPYQENEGNYELHLTNVEPFAGDPAGRVDQIVKAMIPADAPGASIAVVKDNKVVYSKGFGLANLEYDIPITSKTIFHIASVSKQFTAFAIAILVDQGKISLQDEVQKYITELHDFGIPITINQLVHHTSGLRDQWNLLAMAGWRLDDVITKEQILRLISKQRELNAPPGEEFNYCNTGYTLLAEIVSRVTGQSFADWTKENIFDPLEMTNTFFYDDHEKIVPYRAYSYSPRDNFYKKRVLSYATVGATGLFTTVEDLGKWAINLEMMKVGNSGVLEKMEERFILNRGDTISYAFGQEISKYKGLKTVSHTGGDAGYRAMLLRFPEQHFSVAVLSNLSTFSPEGLSYTIAEIYLEGLMKEQQEKDEAPKPEEKNEPFDSNRVKLTEYVGRYYSDELDTYYELEIKDDTLVAHHQRHNDIKLWPTKLDGFGTSVQWMDEVEFVRSKTKKVTGLKASSGRVKNLKFVKLQSE